jgi:hypothetical protein
MASSTQLLADSLVPNTTYIVRRAIRLTQLEGMQLILCLDGAAHDIFCIFRSELALPNQLIQQINDGTMAVPSIYLGKNMHGEHEFDILNPNTLTTIRVMMEALN